MSARGAVFGWAVVAVFWAVIAAAVGGLAGWAAARWFYVGALSVVLLSMGLVGFGRQHRKGERDEPEA